METKYPTPEQVRKETEKLAPVGWIVSHEYPDQIGVHHPTLTDDEFISFGDDNGFFLFNDVKADPVVGSMQDLTDPKEIAESFWQQLAKFYPDLVKEKKETCELCAEIVSFCECRRCFECATLYLVADAIKALNDQDTCAPCADELGE
jgi:hypothetical protein